MAGVAFTLAELARRINARVEGDANAVVSGLGSLATATPGQLTHLSSRAYRRFLPDTRATAVILRPHALAPCPTPALVAVNPYLAFAHASLLFSDRPVLPSGIHPTAIVDPSAVLDADVAVGPHAVIGARCTIGAGVAIGANTVVGDACELAADVRLMPNVTLYHRVRIGARSVVHSGAVIGADG